MDALWACPTHKMFGVGSRTTKHLARLGIQTIGELAHTPLPDLKFKMKRYMKKLRHLERSAVANRQWL